MGIYEESIDPFYGAPQTIYSDHFQWQNVHTGPIGFKLEVPPLQPAFAAGFYAAAGEEITASAPIPNSRSMASSTSSPPTSSPSSRRKKGTVPFLKGLTLRKRGLSPFLGEGVEEVEEGVVDCFGLFLLGEVACVGDELDASEVGEPGGHGLE